MGTVQLPLLVQQFQVFTNRNLRGAEAPGKIGNQKTPIEFQCFENGAPTLFVQHLRLDPGHRLSFRPLRPFVCYFLL